VTHECLGCSNTQLSHLAQYGTPARARARLTNAPCQEAANAAACLRRRGAGNTCVGRLGSASRRAARQCATSATVKPVARQAGHSQSPPSTAVSGGSRQNVCQGASHKSYSNMRSSKCGLRRPKQAQLADGRGNPACMVPSMLLSVCCATSPPNLPACDAHMQPARQRRHECRRTTAIHTSHHTRSRRT
jgi:hypothetical protein